MNSCQAVFNPDRRRRLALAVLSAALLWVVAPAFAEPPAPESKRFLFIIDTSAAMKPMEDAVSETLFDLVYSGVRGHMTNGDTYGIWLLNEQNDTSFKMEVWKQKYAVEIASRAVKHVKDHGFKGKARLSQAMADAAAVIKNVEDLKVILISNGETPISGTPFDDIINLRFREMAPHMKRAKATLNTALVAQEGRIVAWAANSPEFLIDIPYVAPRPPQRKPAATPTNAEAAAVVNSGNITNSVAPKPRIASSPIIITRETVAEERRTWRNMTSTTGNESAGTTNITNVTASASPSAPAVSNVAAPSNAVSVVKPAAPALASSTDATPDVVTGELAVLNSGPTTVATSDTVAVVSAPIIRSVEPSRSSSWSPIVWAGIGAAAAFVFVLGGFLMARSKREQPSLISESIAQERIRTI